jgi:hypothetical protein
MSTILAIADAIVAQIVTGNTAGWFPMPIDTVERRWAPDLQISDVTNLRISVIPRVEARTKFSRIGDDFTATVDLALMRHLPATVNSKTDNAAIDAYATMAQTIGSILARDQLPGLTGVRLVSITHDPLIDQERLVANRAIFSFISTSWRYLADARVPLPAVP